MRLTIIVKTSLALGWFNLVRVIKYRVSVRLGINVVQKVTGILPSGSFFSKQDNINQDANIILRELNAFGYLKYPVRGKYPNWFFNVLNRKEFSDIAKPWYLISDFDSTVGDIKGIWELSRFNWILDLIVLEQKRQDSLALNQLDLWLNHWCKCNPLYQGPNWKCGQEASIRVMNLITGLIGLNQLTQPSENVQQLISWHLKRIAPTIGYAVAQDNNHGTSEAAALFIGGALLNYVMPKPEHKKWRELGRKWLENRAKKLIMLDGGFSQYSVNYHRVVLDTYSLAEIIRQKLNLRKFSDKLYSQLQKATDWLYILTQEENGDAPNIGANDGAHLLLVSLTDYRDFRPSVQLASTLFLGKSYYAVSGSYDKSLSFFGLEKTESISKTLPQKNQLFSKSGLITAKNSNFFIAFKLPIFRFRPSQNDALHLDVWWKGLNILRDGGTYSYNSTQEDLDYFSGVASHNTVQFDQHQQMPRLSRFLFGAWLKPVQLDYEFHHFTCAYQDYWGGRHKREVILVDNQIRVIDTISNFKNQAIVRWRLLPGQWFLCNNVLNNNNNNITIVIHSEKPVKLQLVEGKESRYYYQKQSLPVLEITATQETSITTVIEDLV